MENQREEYIEEGMDLDSGKSLDETIHIDEHKVYDLNGKLDLNLQVNKDGIEGYGHENDALGDRIEVDLNKQEQHGHFSQNADLSIKSHEACMKSYSPAQYEFDHHKEEKSAKIGYDVERLHSEERENEVISGKCSDKSSSPIQTETFVEEPRNEGPVHVPMKVPEAADSRYQVENTGKSNFHNDGLKENPENEFEESLQFENPKSAFEEMDGGDGEQALGNPDYGYEAKKEDTSYSGELKSTNGELERKNVDVRAPGRTSERSVSAVREMSLSPEKGPNEEQYAGLKFSSSPYGVQDSSHSPKSSGPKRSPSSERRVEDGQRALSQDQMHLSVRRSSSISPRRRSRRDSLHRDELFQKPLSISPRRRHKSPDHRRRDRSVSRSPTRRNESSRYRRHYRDRSRSRSPRARDHYRRSPRRFSPRNKSPPSSYRSRRRSPRRRPWSPPPNRSNGIGKPGNNLFIAGFNFMTTERDLERKFSRFGRVRDVRIVRDKRSGDSRGFGFLSLERDEDADEAIRALDQTEWNGRVVLVEKSKSH